MSLLRHRAPKDRNGENVFWERVNAGMDPFPFRGNSPPMLREDEMEDRSATVRDVYNAFFNVTVKAENQQYLEVMEKVFNGHAQLLHIERFWQGSSSHYVEWIELFIEDIKT